MARAAVLSRAAIVACLLLAAGCAGPEGEPVENPDPGAVSGGEGEASRAGYSLDGTWVVFEPDDRRVEVVFELRDGTGTAWETRRPDRRYQLRVTGGSGELKQLVATAPDGDEERVMWSFQSDACALLFAPGEDELLFARRATPVPPRLRGAWVLGGPERPALQERTSFEGAPAPDDVPRLTLSATTVSMALGGEERGGRAWGLTRGEGATEGLALELPRGDRTEIVVMNVEPIGEEAFLLWPNGEDEFRVAHRAGASPSRLGRTTGP